METEVAISALSALAHGGRLEIFRLLVRAGPDGMAAGEIAQATGSLTNTLSTNLAILSRAGLVASRRAGRSIVYTARYEQMRALLGFLMEDCCQGNPAIVPPLAEAAPGACASAGAC